MYIELDKNTEYLLDKLVSSGYSAYVVGGAVRDRLCGRAVSDFDIATSALPSETKAVFSSHEVVETGLKHGTVTVVIDRRSYEITTYRVESEYSDSRRPDSVAFVRELKDDLARRDFTVNALAYSPKEGVVDLFGGISDLENGIIRAVGDPFKRFSEDSLRILRAIRFASVLGFSIERETSSAIFALSDTLSKVSPERILAELKKTLCGKNAQAVINEYLPVIEKVIPVSGNAENVSLLPADFSMRLSCLCGGSSSRALSLLRADNETKKKVGLLLRSTPIPSDPTGLKHYISALGREEALLVAPYRRALYGEDPEMKTEALLSSDECLFINDLAVNGSDLLRLGFSGKEVGETLARLLLSVLDEKIENKKEKLLETAEKYRKCS